MEINFKSEYYLTDEEIVEKYGLSEEDKVYILPQIRKAEDDLFKFITSKV